MAYAMTMNRPAVARFAEGILRAIGTTAAPRIGLKALIGETPYRQPNATLSAFEMSQLRRQTTI